MKLTLLERLVGLSILVKEGDIVFLRARRSIEDKIGLTAEEIEKYEVKASPEGGVEWSPSVPEYFEIDLKPSEIKILYDALEEMNKRKKLTPEHLSLYDKIVEGEE